MIFHWRKKRKDSAENPLKDKSLWLEFLPEYTTKDLVHFQNVHLAPSFRNFNLSIPKSAWVILYGEDDFAKALFCDLCFGYIKPDEGSVSPKFKSSDLNFIGRSNTTYGKSLLDHLTCGVTNDKKELLQFLMRKVFSNRFKRHLNPNNFFEFKENKQAHEVDLDERDFLEIAEVNLLLQKKKAIIIDTTTDFYEIAVELGFQHSDQVLDSEKTIFWIINEEKKLARSAYPWTNEKYSHIPKVLLNFPSGSPVGHIN
ncbi:MAG: hypothetical protein M9962_12800 [Oligoflexia bacterium]|nr:hypothetical protein [Oligoflexia bacterium]